MTINWTDVTSTERIEIFSITNGIYIQRYFHPDNIYILLILDSFPFKKREASQKL